MISLLSEFQYGFGLAAAFAAAALVPLADLGPQIL
jgi:hypothetical protein